jgi:hypothetical protein
VSTTGLLEEAIEAHGGLARYRSASEISVDARARGWALAMRFQRNALSSFRGAVSTREPRVVLSPYPREGERGVLEHDSVRIESDQGDIVEGRNDPRAAFRGFRRNLWWDDLDLLYFGAYALWGYAGAPFIFRNPGFEVEEIEPWREGTETWRGLRVRFPENVPAHSREQRYYFDSRGLIRRNDYTAEVFGSWARAAHYCWDHKEFSGLVMPTRRKAMPRRRNGQPVRQVGLVSLRIDDVTLGGPAE